LKPLKKETLAVLQDLSLQVLGDRSPQGSLEKLLLVSQRKRIYLLPNGLANLLFFAAHKFRAGQRRLTQKI
jgi:hypothetical protein